MITEKTLWEINIADIKPGEPVSTLGCTLGSEAKAAKALSNFTRYLIL